jgi:tRNA(Ile)-lysidine synthetase-like protein
VGSGGIQKLKSLFQIARIPVWERSQWPVLVAGASIVWTRRFGVAAEAAVGPATRTVLQIREAGA